SLRIDPNYVYDNSGKKPPTVASYRASIDLRVKVRDLEILGQVIEEGISAGASTVDGPTSTLDDDAAATDEAITKATKDARRRAEAMAKAAGKSVGDAVSIKETSVEVPSVYSDSKALLRMDSAYAASPAIAVEAGQLDIVADITVVFEPK
ncbi:MAG: SIMPL domain-containing protein, partial [Coriobacteriia bacterium]|nr:SIMPL domain-containing protein [Coriobacteriia bacterium]